MKMNIDLGSKEPCGDISPSMEMEVCYPSFYIESKKELPPIPDEGEMTIRFKKTSSTERKNRHGESYSYQIEVREVVSATGSESTPASSKNKDTESALDALARALKNDEDEDEE